MVPSAEAVATRAPEREKAAASTFFSCPASVATRLPAGTAWTVEGCQKRTSL